MLNTNCMPIIMTLAKVALQIFVHKVHYGLNDENNSVKIMTKFYEKLISWNASLDLS